MNISAQPLYLSQDLNDFDAQKRAAALTRLAANLPGSEQTDPAERTANMHVHSFFSYNALGLSPSALALLGREMDIDLMGLVDFDVVDGVDEFLDACDLLGICGGASMETRVFLPEFAHREINSPGEPGVLYHMGTGFVRSQVSPSAAPMLQNLADRSRQRNLELVERCNRILGPVTLDYAQDVLPLTPSGNATERHIVAAYLSAVEAQIGDAEPFWCERLGVDSDQLNAAQAKPYGLANLVRAKLMKRGGAAYVQPGPATFPSVDEVHALFHACGALPCLAWLDGTSAGEQAMPELVDLMLSKGVVTFNVIPDRNWRLADPEVKREKLQNLYDVVELVTRRGLPILAGTEMNSPGQPLVDDFTVPELAPVRAAFMDGAHFLHGHTMLARHAGLGYSSDWAATHLPDRFERNQFYTEVGRRVRAGLAGVAQAGSLTPDLTPVALLAQIG